MWLCREDGIDGMKMAVLQTGRSIDGTRDVHGDYDDMCKAMLGRAPDEAVTFAVLDNNFPDDITAYDAVVITGSSHGVYEPHSWIPPLEELVRQAYREGVKLIGICFGHQIIAQALGGAVGKSDRGFGVGVMDYDLIDESGASQKISLYAWHQDQVSVLPVDAEVIASSDFCQFAALRYGDRAMSFQAHPEFTRDYMNDLAEARRGGVISDEMGADAIASLSRPVDADRVKSLMVSFLEA
jgi:GMP synthase-like glutamine amidotransferase